VGYLFHILVALGSVALAEAGVESGWRLPWLLVLALPVPHLMARWIRALSLAGSFRRAARLQRLLAASPPLVQLVGDLALGWNASVAAWLGRSRDPMGVPDASLLLALAPFLVLELIAIDARARQLGQRAGEVRRARRFQLRMFLSGLLPVALYVGGGSLLGMHEGLRVRVLEVQLLSAGTMLVVFFGFALILPALLRNTWETTRLEPGLQRTVLTAVAERAGFRCRDLLVWKTGNLMANAAIVGFLPWQRVVLFSDALLAQLGPRELAAVFGHEIGHARRHHVAVFAAWSLAFVLAADLVLRALAIQSELAAALVAALFFLGWYLTFGYLSRRFELEADVESAELVGETRSLIDALEHVGGFHSRGRSSWRHFSTAQRVLFLRALAREPAIAERLRAALRRWRRLGYALFAAALVAQVWVLSSDWNEEQLVADLRLGRFGSAVERAAAADELPAWMDGLVRRARDAVDGESAEALEARARGAARGGDWEQAADWLGLACLRGRAELEAPWNAIELAVAGRRAEARAALDELSDPGSPWRSELAPLLGPPSATGRP